MRNSMILFYTAMLLLYIHPTGNAMNNQYLSVHLSCHENPACTYNGGNMKVDIKITNTSPEEIGFPLAYIKRRGPTATLIDKESKEKLPLDINPAPYKLLKDFTKIKPGQSLTMDTIIWEPDIKHFRKEFVDLILEISPSVKIQINKNGDLVHFGEKSTLEIKGPDTISREAE